MGMNRDMRFYNDGLARAYEIVKSMGIEGLEAEIRKRGAYSIPANTNSYQVRKAAREYCSAELMIVATAMAATLELDMMLPPSALAQFLYKFNEKCDTFRDNPKEFQETQERLNRQYSLNKTVELYNKKYKEEKK